MTEIILTFPVRKQAPLICVWVTTGNSSQPLACRWVAGREPSGVLAAHEVDEPEGRRLCA